MDSDYLVIILAVVTISAIIGFALWQRGRVAQSKGDTKRSAFVENHGEAPRQNRPGTEH